MFPMGWTTKEHVHECTEGIILEVKPPNLPAFVVATVYNHPGDRIKEGFIKILDRLAKRKPVLLSGDLNAASFELGSRTNTCEGEHLVEMISKTSLSYIDNESPTYISASSGSWNILDFSFANKLFLDRIVDFEVGNDFGSDHLPTIIKYATIPLEERD